MTTQEIVDKFLETSGQDFPTQLKALAKKNMARILEQGESPKEFLNLPDHFVEFSYKQAYNLFQAGKFKEAIKIFDMLIMLDPTDNRFLLGSAACHLHLNDFSMAGAYYILAKEVEPFNPVPSFHLYDCYIKLNQPAAALYELERVIVLSSQDPKFNELKERALLEKSGLIERLKSNQA